MAALDVAAHLSPADLGRRYRAARGAIERSHLQIIWLLSQGREGREGAAVSGYGLRWIGAIVQRYNTSGPDGLGGGRAGNAGARPLLDADGGTALRAALGEAPLGAAVPDPPADGGRWTGPKVASWMGARLGRRIWAQRGWDYLRKLGHSLQTPRPRNVKAASAEEQELYKKARRAGE